MDLKSLNVTHLSSFHEPPFFFMKYTTVRESTSVMRIQPDCFGETIKSEVRFALRLEAYPFSNVGFNVVDVLIQYSLVESKRVGKLVSCAKNVGVRECIIIIIITIPLKGLWSIGETILYKWW